MRKLLLVLLLTWWNAGRGHQFPLGCKMVRHCKIGMGPLQPWDCCLSKGPAVRSTFGPLRALLPQTLRTQPSSAVTDPRTPALGQPRPLTTSRDHGRISSRPVFIASSLPSQDLGPVKHTMDLAVQSISDDDVCARLYQARPRVARLAWKIRRAESGKERQASRLPEPSTP